MCVCVCINIVEFIFVSVYEYVHEYILYECPPICKHVEKYDVRRITNYFMELSCIPCTHLTQPFK